MFFFLFFFKVEYFLKSKKHVKHDSLLCSYLVLRFSVRLSSSLKTSIRVIYMDRWRSLSVLLFNKKEKKEKKRTLK